VRAAFEKRRFVLLYHGHELSAKDLDATHFADGRCDGLILTPPFSFEKFAAPLLDIGIPFVTVGDSADNPLFPSVDVDNISAARELTEYLLQRGHRQILGLAWRGYSHSALLRLPSCRHEVERSGGTYNEEILPRGDKQGTLEVLCRYLDAKDRNAMGRPTALFCLTDDVAVEVLPLLQEIGFNVPRDRSVVGFDDAPVAGEANLTTIRQDPVRIGEEAVRLLLRLIDPDHQSSERTEEAAVIIPAYLVERGSVAPPPPTPSFLPTVKP
jgi:LacI family transcriptional regulator